MAHDPRALLARMLLMRRFEEMVIRLAADHKYIGRNHLYIGHEGVGAPVLTQLRAGDLSYSTHRNHGHMIARGVDPGRALAEILGRVDGLCGGKGGTWHMTDKESGFGSTSAMVGGSIGLSVGGGFAQKQAGKGNVAVACFGDGVLDEGISYEALNIASLFKLPVLFLCENNSKTGERQTSMSAARKLLDIPRALRIEAAAVDGGNAEAVATTAERALARIRETGAPFFIEARLQRWPGSFQMKPEFTTGVTDVSMAWDAAKISGEHADWLRIDPILAYVRRLLKRKALSRDEVEKIDRETNDTMQSARTFAEASPFPQPEAAVAGVFV